MNEHERRIVSEVMAQAEERRARLVARHRSVIAGARFVRVEHARLPAPRTQTDAPEASTAAAVSYGTEHRWRTPSSWDKPDGFELAVFRPPGTRVYVPPHLYKTTDRAWRRWEVP